MVGYRKLLPGLSPDRGQGTSTSCHPLSFAGGTLKSVALTAFDLPLSDVTS